MSWPTIHINDDSIDSADGILFALCGKVFGLPDIFDFGHTVILQRFYFIDELENDVRICPECKKCIDHLYQ